MRADTQGHAPRSHCHIAQESKTRTHKQPKYAMTGSEQSVCSHAGEEA